MKHTSHLFHISHLFEIRDLLVNVFKYIERPLIFNKLSHKLHKEKPLKIRLHSGYINEIKSLYGDHNVKHINFTTRFCVNTINDALLFFRPQYVEFSNVIEHNWNELYNAINNSEIYKITLWTKTCPELSFLKNITHVKLYRFPNKIHGSIYIKKIYVLENKLSNHDIVKFPNVERIQIRNYDGCDLFKKYDNTNIKKYSVVCDKFISNNTSMYESMKIHCNELYLQNVQMGVKYLTIIPQFKHNIDKQNYVLYEKHSNNINKMLQISRDISIDIRNNFINDGSDISDELLNLCACVKNLTSNLSHLTTSVYNPFNFNNKKEINTPDLEELTVCTGTKYVFASTKLRKLILVFALEKFSIDVIQSHIDYYDINNPTVIIKIKQKYPNIDEIMWCHNRGIVIKK